MRVEQIGDCTLYLGDCLSIMPLLNAVDLVIADPPYNIGKAKWDSIPNYEDWFLLWAEMAKSHLPKSGALYVWHNDPTQIPRLIENMKTLFVFRQFITVVKQSNRVYNWRNRTPGNAGWWSDVLNWYPITEYVLFFTLTDPLSHEWGIERLRDYSAYMNEVRYKHHIDPAILNTAFGYVAGCHWWFSKKQPRLIGRQDYSKLQSMHPEFFLPYDNLISPVLEFEKNNRHRLNLIEDISNVWQWDFHNSGVSHPTQKPVELIDRMVRASTKVGDIILDPFMGSGTTGVACAKLGRKFIGIEINEKYFDIACKRIEEAYKQPDMFIQAAEPKPEQGALL